MDPIEHEVRNLVRLHRHSNAVARGARRAFRRAVLSRAAAAAGRHAPTTVLPRYRDGRVEKLLAELVGAARAGYRDVYRTMLDDLAAIGVDQSRYAASVLSDAVAGATATITAPVNLGQARRMVREGSIDGLTLKEWLSAAEGSYVDAAKREVRRVVASGGTSDAVRRAMTGRTARTARRHLDSLARTATTFVASRGKEETYRANSDVLAGIEFVATLDSRTTIVCARWDGTVWPVDDPGIQRPPLHVGCRSTLAPVVDWDGLGLEPPRSGTRASEDGPTSARSYDKWFRRQSREKQDAIVGPTRGKLYRSGKIAFRDMVTRDNRVAPIDQLTQG